MYTVEFYIDTGLNAVNTADDLAHVQAFAASTVTVQNCDIISCRGLDSFRVAISEAQLQGADFCYVYGEQDAAVFSIDGTRPTSPDVTEVFVTIDPWLTSGGILAVDFLDGITERHHVPKSADTFGAYTEPDPYIAPSKPLEIVDGGIKINYTGTSYNLIEASLNISAMGAPGYALAKSYIDSGTGEKVTVPCTTPLRGGERTAVTINVPHASPLGAGTPVTSYFDARVADVFEGYGVCRDFGVEGAILNSWVLPSYFVDDAQVESTGRVSTIESSDRSESSGLPFIYGNASNLRCFCGEYNKYVIQAVASGNASEFNPEDIFHTGDSAPLVVACADPRPHGKPFFRFEYYRGSTDFWQNCVPGLEWQTAPLVFYDKQGRTIDRFTFYAERGTAGELHGVDIANTGFQMAEDAGSSALSSGLVLDSSERWLNKYNRLPRTKAYDLVNIGAGALKSLANGIVGLFTGEKKFNLARQDELRRFNISQYVVEPLIMYPREETIRDFLGNGARVYRLRYSNSDLAKVDKILTAYGYKDTAMIEKSFFTNRSKFNYIRASGVTVKTSAIPRWLRDLLATQLSVGIRIWHTKPDPAAYTDGTNV